MNRWTLYGWLAFVHTFLALVAYGFMVSRSGYQRSRS